MLFRFLNRPGIGSVRTFFVEPSASVVPSRDVSGLDPWLESIVRSRPWDGSAWDELSLHRGDISAARWMPSIFWQDGIHGAPHLKAWGSVCIFI